MSSLFTRGWIALVLLVATPLVGVAQRGGDDADAYPENDYGDARQEAESPRLFRGGLMHQLRSVTESVLGEGEEKRPAPETNRNIPKPPPLNAQPRRSTASGRTNPPENARGDDQENAGANRNWAGQFLAPNYRSRAQAPASRPTAPNDRSNERRVYMGERSGQRAAPNTGGASGPMTQSGSREANKPPTRSQANAAPAGEIALEASDTPAPAPREQAAQATDGPAEVVVSHVPDVPYVPRKPLPKRDPTSSPSTTKKNSGNEPQSGATRSGGSAKPKPSAATPAQNESGLTLGSPNEAAKPSPAAVPSLEGASLPAIGVPSPAADSPALEPESMPSLPSLGSPALGSPALGSPGLGAPGLPELNPATGGLAPDGALPGSDAADVDLSGSLLPSTPAQPGLPPSALPSGTAAKQGNPAAGNQERMHMEVPHVVVKLLGPGDLATGTPTTYELVVENPDRIALNGLILRMETPPGVDIVKNGNWGDAVELEKAEDGATLLLWNVAGVAAGGSTKLGLDLKASTSRNFAVAIEWAVLPQEGIDELTVKQPDLQVALEGPVDVEKDVANVYRVRISNPGNAVARNVKVQVGAAAQQASQVEIGDLAAGGSEVVEMDLTFEKAGRLEIGANALADGSLNRKTNIVVNVRQPVLQASLSLPKSALLGDNVFATMELRNSGDGPARKVQAGLMVPTDSEVINPPSGVTRQGDKLLWEVEIVPPGQVVTVPIELRLPSAGPHGLKFACVTPSGAVTSAEASTTVEAFADLKLLVNDPPAPAPIGSPVVYELTITNRGTRDARNVSILAQFSEGIEPQSATGLKNRVVPGQVLFDAIPKIAAGETVKVKLTALASVPGMHRFRAEVRCEESDARLVEEESTRYLESASRIASPPSTLIQR